MRFAQPHEAAQKELGGVCEVDNLLSHINSNGVYPDHDPKGCPSAPADDVDDRIEPSQQDQAATTGDKHERTTPPGAGIKANTAQ